MVYTKSDLDPVFKALADPVRRGMLARLQDGPASVGDLAAPLDMSLAGAAKHVKILVDARLVRKKKIGRTQLCSLDPTPLRSVQSWLDTYAIFWGDRLDALEAALEQHNRTVRDVTQAEKEPRS